MSTDKKTLYISFFSGIDQRIANNFMTLCNNAIKEHDPGELYFFIASGGGDVDSGFVMSNYLTSLHGHIKITMHNVGNIDSIANVIFISADKRFAAPNAAFLFHGVAMNAIGALSRMALKENLTRCQGMEDRIIATMSSRSKLSPATLQELFNQGEGKDVNFALEHGIIDEIQTPVLPPGAVHLVMNFQ